MSKTGLIIAREYNTRVRKKSFLLITFITPVLFALLIVSPMLISQLTTSEKTIYVFDESNQFESSFNNTDETSYEYLDQYPDEKFLNSLLEENSNYFLHIPKMELDNPQGIEVISRKNPGLSVIQGLESKIENRIENLKLEKSGIKKSVLESLETEISIASTIMDDQGETRKGSTAAASAVSFIGGFLIYIFIFMYGGQVTTGVHEEKSSRIVEIIISSVKPFEMMLGKIVGIALVGLTQFILWVILTGFLITAVGLVIAPGEGMEMGQNAPMAQGSDMMAGGSGDSGQEMVAKIMEAAGTLNIAKLLGLFIFYFLSGYFLYSSLFAAVAAAVDSQSDMRQFIFPISLPLIFAVVMNSAVMQNPDSGLAVWLSIIPLTSPVVMISRIPFEVPFWQLLLSMVFMVIGFIGAVWMAAKVYRTGILLYGQKISPKDIFKWIMAK